MKKLINRIKKLEIKKIIDKHFQPILYCYCLLCAIIFLFVCSKSSPLYPMNNWNDANSFFTMGKGMANGLIIYQDLFEQKGPLLYLLHAIAYLISNQTFLGIFIFEVISFSVFLYFMNKIICMYFKKIHTLWATPLLSFLILSSYVFLAGDSAEEFCMPLLAISLCHMLHYYKYSYPNKMPTKQVVGNGILAGVVLTIKFNLLGFWFGWAAFLCIGLLIHKKVKEAILTGVYFLLGMILPVLPWIIYFAVNHALYDMLNVYFFVNITSYSEQVSLWNRITMALHNAFWFGKTLSTFFIITTIGYVYTMLSKTILPNIYGKIALTITVLLFAIGIYFGTVHVYYFLILMPFAILGILCFCKIIEKYIKGKGRYGILFLSPIYIVLFVILSCRCSPNFAFHQYKKEDMVQYQFAEIIQNKENATLLNYGFLDGGFYTVCNITPNIKYFHSPNIKYESYPEIADEQKRYIQECIIDFVVIQVEKEEDSKEIPYLYENYEPVKTVYVEDESRYYMLFEVKEK